MKKIVKYLAFAIILLFSLLSFCSCNNITKFNKWHPTQQYMSKWVSYSTQLHIELYIVDWELGDYMVIDYGDKEIAYIVMWHQNYLSQMSISDIRETSFNGSELDHLVDTHQKIYYYDVELISEDCFKLNKHSAYNLNENCEIPEWMLPNEIVMTRVATQLTEEDIPNIDLDENYGLCPGYRDGTQWISNDNQISIDMTGAGRTSGIGEVTFAEEADSRYYIGFFEVNSKAYLMKIEKDATYSFCKDKLASATEEWKCEYFNNYFTAEVVRSDHYETGHIITFTLVETTQN